MARVWMLMPGVVFVASCAAPPRAPQWLPPADTPAPVVAPAPLRAPPVEESLEERWTRELESATPAKRARARSLLDVCSVIEERPDDPEGSTLSCLPDSFGTPRTFHAFRVMAHDEQGYGDAESEVRGSFVVPGAEERLVMLWGESNGSSGLTSGFLFRHVGADWPLVKTFVSFPATSCAAVPRPGLTSLVLCGFDNHWMGMTSVWADLYDLAAPLQEDSVNAPEPTAEHGRLPPLQAVLDMGQEERVVGVHICPGSIRNVTLLPRAPVHVTSTPDGARLTVLVHTTTLAAARKKMCNDDAPDEPGWPVHELTYDLGLRGERLVTKPSPVRTKQDAELRRLALIPPH